jgi:hypothetical protein
MLRSRGLLLTAQVWLTAILTLLSGVPRFSCVCPDGSVRSSFLGVVFSGGKVCCCAESPSAPGAPRKSCCAAHAGGRSAPSSPSRGSQCHKTVATSDALSAPAAPANGDVQAPALPAPPPAAESFAAVHAASAPVAFLSPPTDLTIRLRHLVI